MTAPKTADVLADELRARIRSGEWPEGLGLPTERDLAAQTALSRTTVREALRMLEVDGLIEIRPGRGGGARVRRPAGDEMTRQLELFIWGRNIGVDQLHDVRTALEALGAEGAARNRTEADLADLVVKTAAVESAVGDISRYLDANLAWHMAVVRASHNELLISFMEVLSQAIHDATEIAAFDSEEVRMSTLKIHRAILAAIVDGDADAARRRMTRHVSAAREVALGRSGDLSLSRRAVPSPKRGNVPKPATVPAKRRRPRAKRPTSKEAK
ncbi:MAG: FadR family transcriptional regulator [Betaproteobacteria bacterium]|nr:FadR family transcriptional regulator [Betaproteobacteria bacterium]